MDQPELIDSVRRLAIRWYRGSFFAKPMHRKLMREHGEELLALTEYDRPTCNECLHLELDHVPGYGCFECLSERLNGAFHEYVPGGGFAF